MSTALADAVTAHKHPHGYEVTPLRTDGRTSGWLVVVRDESIAGRIAACVREASRRWRLTPQQSRVLERIIRGQSNAAIAADLDVSERAVELHITALFDKINVDGRAAMVAAVLLTQ
jgi:DNA-binding NarL/FixJ family response regulator